MKPVHAFSGVCVTSSSCFRHASSTQGTHQSPNGDGWIVDRLKKFEAAGPFLTRVRNLLKPVQKDQNSGRAAPC